MATHHLIQERGQVKVGDDVVVVGPGPMGVMACHMLNSAVRGVLS